MGRSNRSRKRSDEMNKIKKVRYAAKELIRLKKTLGLLDAQGNEINKTIEEIATVKTSKEIKKDKKILEEEEIVKEMKEKEDKGENITIVNEKTGKSHTYNSKTLKDEFGTHPPWFKARKSAKRMRKLNHARKMRFKQAWTTVNVPL